MVHISRSRFLPVMLVRPGVPARSASALACAALASAAIAAFASPASAQLFMVEPPTFPGMIFQEVIPERAQPEAVAPEGSDSALAANLRRQVVAYPGREAPGTIVIDTPNTYLYFVLGGGRAMRYGIGVGREGFTWSGMQTIARKTEWPDWHPPAEMIARQPYLPRFMAGGPGNPLGARAMYLGNSLYRIHGTNAPNTIGQRVSSGCIRLVNEDVVDLFNRVTVGTRVVVLPDGHRRAPANVASAPQPRSATRTSMTQIEPVAQPDVAAEEPSWFAPRPMASSPAYLGTSQYNGAAASRLY